MHVGRFAQTKYSDRLRVSVAFGKADLVCTRFWHVCADRNECGFRCAIREPVNLVERIEKNRFIRIRIKAANHPALARAADTVNPAIARLPIRFMEHDRAAQSTPAEQSQNDPGTEGEPAARPGH